MTPRSLRIVLLAGCFAVAALSGLALASPAAADRRPDINLAAGQTFEYRSTRPTAGSGAGVSLIFTPSQCAAPPHGATCDVFNLNLELDESDSAFNFVTAKLDWESERVPALMLGVVGLGLGPATDYNTYVWEINDDGTHTRRADITGGLNKPELVGFQATKPEYVITIQNSQGASTGYTLNVSYSNEKFETPFEVLDPSLNASTPIEDRSADEPVAALTPVDPAPLGDIDMGPMPVAALEPSVANVASDSDFAGFRAAVDETLEGDLAAFRPGQQAAVPLPDPPSTVAVVFWLLVAPLALGLLLFLLFRRRSTAEAAEA